MLKTYRDRARAELTKFLAENNLSLKAKPDYGFYNSIKKMESIQHISITDCHGIWCKVYLYDKKLHFYDKVITSGVLPMEQDPYAYFYSLLLGNEIELPSGKRLFLNEKQLIEDKCRAEKEMAKFERELDREKLHKKLEKEFVRRRHSKARKEIL